MGSDLVGQLTRQQAADADRRLRRARPVPDPGHAQAPVPARRRRDAARSPPRHQSGPDPAAAASRPARRPRCPRRTPPSRSSRRSGSTRSELELAADLIDLVDPVAGGDLLDRVKSLRRKVATDLGVVVPPVRTRDNLDLPLHTYAIRLFGVEVARGEAPPGHGAGDRRPPRRAARPPYPGAGLRAGRRSGCPFELRNQAEMLGATVVDRSSVLTTHLAEVVRSYASQLLGREDVKMLTDAVRRTHPVVGRGAHPGPAQPRRDPAGAPVAARRERLDPRPGPDLRGALHPGPDQQGPRRPGRPPPARRSAWPSSPRTCATAPCPCSASTRGLEQRLLEALRVSEGGGFLALDLDLSQALMNDLTARNRQAEDQNISAVLVCAPQVRPAVRRLVATTLPRLPVLSYGELGGADPDPVRRGGRGTGPRARLTCPALPEPPA